MKNLKIKNPGSFEYYDTERKVACSANFPLFLIQNAWHRGCNFEKEADGYGQGMGTMGDWSGIRDSSEGAVAKMLEKAIKFLKLI